MDPKLALFLAVARQQNLTKVAKSLQLSKSQVSRRLTQLEAELGFKLFNRTPQNVSLTEAGSQLLQHGQTMETVWSSALEQLTQRELNIEGTIKISMPMALGEHIIMPKLVDFAESNPALQFTFDVDNNLRNALLDDFDLIFRSALTLPDSNLKARLLVEYPLVICASKDYLEKNGTPQQVSDLQAHDCIGGQRSHLASHQTEWHFQQDKQAKALTLNTRFSVKGYNIELALVQAGLGIAQLPLPFVEEAIHGSEVVPLLNDQGRVKTKLWLLHPYDKIVPKRIRLLIDHLVAEFGQLKKTDAVCKLPKV